MSSKLIFLFLPPSHCRSAGNTDMGPHTWLWGGFQKPNSIHLVWTSIIFNHRVSSETWLAPFLVTIVLNLRQVIFDIRKMKTISLAYISKDLRTGCFQRLDSDKDSIAYGVVMGTCVRGRQHIPKQKVRGSITSSGSTPSLGLSSFFLQAFSPKTAKLKTKHINFGQHT